MNTVVIDAKFGALDDLHKIGLKLIRSKCTEVVLHNGLGHKYLPGFFKEVKGLKIKLKFVVNSEEFDDNLFFMCRNAISDGYIDKVFMKVNSKNLRYPIKVNVGIMSEKLHKLTCYVPDDEFDEYKESLMSITKECEVDKLSNLINITDSFNMSELKDGEVVGKDELNTLGLSYIADNLGEIALLDNHIVLYINFMKDDLGYYHEVFFKSKLGAYRTIHVNKDLGNPKFLTHDCHMTETELNEAKNLRLEYGKFSESLLR